MEVIGETYAHIVVADPAIQQPPARLRDLHRLRQHFAQEDYLDAAVAHGIDEGQMFYPGLLDPDDIVEEKLFSVRWRQPGERSEERRVGKEVWVSGVGG